VQELLKRILNLIITLYLVFYLGLFITDYSFILKKGLSNIAGFTALLFFLLLSRYFLDKPTFWQLSIFKKLNWITKLNDKLLLLVIFILIISIISVLGIMRHLSLSSLAWDMGIFDQAIWNTLQGDMFFSSIRGNMNLLGDHFEPILFLLVPFYAIWPHVFTLVIIQALVLALSVFPLYLIAKNKLNNRFLVFSFIISFALSKAIRGIGLSDFHPECFMVPLSFFAFYFLIKKKYFLFFLTILLLIACKETAVFIVLGLGIYTLFVLKRRITGLCLIAMGILSWIIETKIIIPAFSNDKTFLYYVRLPFGTTYQQNLNFVLNHPIKFLKFIFMPKKVNYCFKLLGPVGFTSIFAPTEYILIILPILSILLGSAALCGYYLLSSHYVGHVLPFVYISAIYGTGNLVNIFQKLKFISDENKLKKINNFIAIYVIILSLFFYGKTDAYKLNKFIDGAKQNHASEKIAYLSLVPKEVSVSATSNLVPHLSHRKYIYAWEPDVEVAFITEYIVIDLDFLMQSSRIDKNKISEDFAKLAQRNYKKIFSNQEQTFFIFTNPNSDKSAVKNFRGNLGI
jgi:uncharacterized membrane protein